MKKIALFITVLLITLSAFGQSKETTITKVTLANINFRSTPEFAKNKICVIPKGTELTLISGIMQYGDWVPIEYKGKIGYVHAKYVKRKIAKQNKSVTNSYSSKSVRLQSLSGASLGVAVTCAGNDLSL